MTEQHIDNGMLAMFVKMTSPTDDDRPDAGTMNSRQYDEVLDHLAGCEECRDQVTVINTLSSHWPDIQYQSMLTDEQQQMICEYIDGVLAAEDSTKIKALIESNDDAMKAALHYQSHVESMAMHLSAEDISTPEVTIQRKIEPFNVSFLAKTLSLIDQFFNIKSPLVYTMTATAALFVAVTLLVNIPDIKQQQSMIVSYQDNPTIQFTEKNKLPGIGFFTNSANRSKPFASINIELISENTIKITWPEVDGVELYNMRIQVFNQGKKIVLKETSTQNNHAIFKLKPEKKQADNNDSQAGNNHKKRYEWILYGSTTDERMFYASGGFIFDKGY